MEMRRNQPKVQARALWAAGTSNSATFRPGDTTATKKTGREVSLVDVQASTRNPRKRPATAGTIQRNRNRGGIASILSDGAMHPGAGNAPRVSKKHPGDLVPVVKRSRHVAHYRDSKALPNSNASVLTNGGTFVRGASRGGNWSGNAWGSTAGRVVLPACCDPPGA